MVAWAGQARIRGWRAGAGWAGEWVAPISFQSQFLPVSKKREQAQPEDQPTGVDRIPAVGTAVVKQSMGHRVP